MHLGHTLLEKKSFLFLFILHLCMLISTCVINSHRYANYKTLGRVTDAG